MLTSIIEQPMGAEMKTYTKHTPKPWLISGKTVYALDENGIANRIRFFIDGGHVKRSSSLHGGGPDNVKTSEAELLATAQVAAAAPDMLEALQGLLACCEAYPAFQKTENTITHGRVEFARAAIAKARGEG